MKKEVILTIAVIILAGFLFLFYQFESKKFIFSLPEYAKEYSVTPLKCAYIENICSDIIFSFGNYQNALNYVPNYEIQENFETAETKIVFNNVKSIDAQFDYNDVIKNPLIEKVDYYKENNDFIVIIDRKGAFLPAKVMRDGAMAIIKLEEGDKNFPILLDQKPANDAAAYPAYRKISFRAELKSPLKKAVVIFQNKIIEVSTIETEPNKYFFYFNGDIKKDENYKVKAIVRDDQDRTTVAIWEFYGQTPSQGVLGENRFKYLGWWGGINANGVSVREKPTQFSERLGTFSSINRVKVLKEVEGQTINDNGVWYEVDGGQYPHAYVFSEYVTPMVQPEPPQEFTVPKGVEEGEYWIDVDLTKKIITLFLYDKPVFSSYVATGKEENPTIAGTFNVWYKVEKARMRGGPPLHEYKYDLADVPNVLYYEGSYAIHGTYWHDKFGLPQSAGCTNLTQGDAVFIFDKVNPKLEPGQEYVFSLKDNPGTIVNNHQ